VQQIRRSRIHIEIECLKPTVNFVADVHIAVARVDTKVLFEHIDKGQIGQRRAVWTAASVQPGEVGSGKKLATLVQQA
jgi:hypothetical protein